MDGLLALGLPFKRLALIFLWGPGLWSRRAKLSARATPTAVVPVLVTKKLDMHETWVL